MAYSSLSLQKIISYANITPDCENLIEAERILRSDFIITIGATKMTYTTIKIFALCIESEDMKDQPLIIKGKLIACSPDPEYEIGDFHCSCKDGAAACKHKTAVLLMCYKMIDINKMQRFSSKDVKYIMEHTEEMIDGVLHPRPLCELFNGKRKVVKHEVKSKDTEEFLQKIVELCPDSALAQLYRKSPKKENDEQDLNPTNSTKRAKKATSDSDDEVGGRTDDRAEKRKTKQGNEKETDEALC